MKLGLLCARQELDQGSLRLEHRGLIASSHNHRHAAARFDVDLVTSIADTRDDLLHKTKLPFRLLIDCLEIRYGPGRDNQSGGGPLPLIRFAATIEILPDLFSNKRHEGMPPGISAVDMSTKREAFQILLAKLRLPTMRSSTSFMSLPGVLLVASVKRRASVPYLSMTSSGSTTLFLDLLIFSPLASRTNPCR